MSEQSLEHTNIDVLFKQVHRKAAPQRMRHHSLGNLRSVSGGMNDAVELARGEMVDRVPSWKQPPPGPFDPAPRGPAPGGQAAAPANLDHVAACWGASTMGRAAWSTIQTTMDYV